MLIHRNYLIEKVVSNDPTRYVLSTMELVQEGDQAYLIATNDRALAKVPVTLDEGDTLGKVSADALIAARKATPRWLDAVELELNGAQAVPNGPTFPRPTEASHGTYPELRNAWPTAPATFSVSLDADQLHALARAVGNKIVTLEFVDATTAIRVRGHANASGILMPCKA